MKTLVLTSRAPTSRSSGYDLRVEHLCRLTPGERHLVVVPLVPDPGGDLQDPALAQFSSARRVDGLGSGPQGRRRHLRLGDQRYLRASRPGAFAAVRDEIAGIVASAGIDRVVVFGTDLAELAAAVGHPWTLLDVCDSVSLTRRRQLEVVPATTVAGRLKGRLDLARSRAQEKRVPGQFRIVTTISEQDSAEVRDLAGGAANVATVPNGVDEAFLASMPPAGQRRGVAFWGNLDFGPNQEALRYFLGEVHGPHLREEGVHVRIIGARAPDWLVATVAADEQVELLGFVPDLRAALADLPVAVNAMRTGSGLKNKVLEAFGLGMVVVTTTRGVEALSSVRHGTHVMVADDAEGFARAVLDLLDDAGARDRMRAAARALLEAEYTWSVIGGSWRRLLEVATEPGAARGAVPEDA